MTGVSRPEGLGFLLRIWGLIHVTLNLGILLALACAVVTQLGFLYKHRGANAAPKVDIRRPLRTVRNLFASPWFAIGMAVALGAWLLHVAALALAPLSVVQAVLSTGVVMLAVLADRLFGFSVGRRQWIGVTILASVIAFYASARGLQDGEAVPVIASTSTAANVSCILGGIVVFGDPMPTDTVGIALQAFAFALVIVAAIVTPPPMRAAESRATA